MNIDFYDIEAMRRISLNARSKTSIEQINRAIMESAKEGFFIAKCYVHLFDGNSLSYKNVTFKEDDPEIIWLKDAGYQVKIFDNDPFSHLMICWAENAIWSDEEKDWIYDTKNR